ncbi:MAG: phosphotransferase family protein [Hyphomonadaceae bacterium]|nr:phosphotransferase family protein [Hyphomonadaceae bacterium]
MPEAVQYPELAAQLAAYYSAKIANGAPVKVTAMTRIPGGASRETYSVDAEIDGTSRGLILRRDPAASLIDTDRAVEFAAIGSVYGHSGLPVPEAIALETDPEPLGGAFFLMSRIDGGTPLNPFRIQDIDPHRASIGQQFFRHLGMISAVEAEKSALAGLIDLPDPALCWQRELDYWAGEIAKDQAHPEPIAEAAIRWLRANPPPPAQRLSVVHGDYRSGNFLHDGAGNITAILDWEMAHIGDPYEDLAWATDPLWCGGEKTLAAGFLPWPDAIAIWQESSGCRFDPAAFEWWSIFSSVKGLAIWISAAKAYAEGENDDPILAWSGWFTHAAHDLILASRLAPKFGVEVPA